MERRDIDELTDGARRFVEAFEANTKGMEALSTGVCGGCDECRGDHDDYTPREDWPDPDDDECPMLWHVKADPKRWFDTEEEADAHGKALFEEAVSSGHVESGSGFSWSSCDLCGSPLGGDREVYHWLNEYTKGDGTEVRTLVHDFGACVDCVVYLANGDTPEEWGEEEDDQ